MTDLSQLNEQVARKLGWDVFLSGQMLSKLGEPISTPDYCGSIEAAWEIVEIIKKEYEWCDLTFNGTEWEFSVPMEPKESAPTAPEAICREFLKLP